MKPKWVGLLAILLLAAIAYGADDSDWTIDSAWAANYFSKMFATFSLLDVPISAQARYDLFHTAYITQRRIHVVDRPLIPGDEVREMLTIAQSIREMIQNSPIHVATNETGLYVYHDGDLMFAMEKTANREEADIYFDEWISIQIDANTWLNYTNAYIKGGEFLLLYYLNSTHRLYIIALAKEGDGGC